MPPPLPLSCLGTTCHFPALLSLARLFPFLYFNGFRSVRAEATLLVPSFLRKTGRSRNERKDATGRKPSLKFEPRKCAPPLIWSNEGKNLPYSILLCSCRCVCVVVFPFLRRDADWDLHDHMEGVLSAGPVLLDSRF